MFRKVLYARFHQTIYSPGAGDLGNVFPPQSKTLEGLSMRSTDQGLLAAFAYKGIKNEILIPFPNIVILSLAPEEKPEPVLKAVKAS